MGRRRRGGSRAWAVVLVAALSAALVTACPYRETRVLTSPGAAPAAGGAARFHLRDGRVVLFRSWHVTEAGGVVGQGEELDADRQPLRSGLIRLDREEIAIIETSGRETAPYGAYLFLSVATVAVAVACVINPKACFGSCPTFYVPSAASEDGWALQAEGFSTSISPALEADDLDDLPLANERDGVVELLMRNEAFETHVVRRLALLVVDSPAGATPLMLEGGSEFVAVGAARAAEGCEGEAVRVAAAAEGAACAAVAAADGDELVLPSDGVDLATRTELRLRFAAPGTRRVAVALTARNTLMTTFVLYQLYAYFGREAGALLASIQRHDWGTWAALAAWGAALPGVRVEARQGGAGGAGAWRPVGLVRYIGPIATQTRGLVFEVEDPAAPVELRLSYARADWRLDAVTLAPVVEGAVTVREVPAEIAAASLTAGAAAWPLVTLPGDSVRLRFAVPARPAGAAPGQRGYFLAARGYYLQWMRTEWLAEEDVPRAWRLFHDPAAALRELAPAYKRVEPEMDAIFEASKFRRGSL